MTNGSPISTLLGQVIAELENLNNVTQRAVNYHAASASMDNNYIPNSDAITNGDVGNYVP